MGKNQPNVYMTSYSVSVDNIGCPTFDISLSGNLTQSAHKYLYKTNFPSQPLDIEELTNELIGDVVVKCQYCGQWAARKTACKHCGGAVE